MKKYQCGDKISFRLYMKDGEQVKEGEVYIVDANRVFESPGIRSYDIFVKSENTLYKHISENYVVE